MKHLRDDEARLQKELELKAVPQAVEDRLRRVYAELPRDMPAAYTGPSLGRESREGYEEVEPVQVRRLPWLVRGALGVCGAAVFMALLLLGLNFTYPEFAESLPGLGGLFEKMNTGDPVNTDNEEGMLSQAALGNTNSDYHLQVKDATCDGERLTIDVELTTAEHVLKSKYHQVEPYFYSDKYSRPDVMDESRDTKFTIDGQRVKPEEMIGHSALGPGQEIFSYTFPLPEKVDNGQVLSVSVDINSLAGYDGNRYDEGRFQMIPVGFKEEFTVTVNSSGYSLYIEDASCDGEYIYLSWEVQFPESAEEYLWIEPRGEIEDGGDHGQWVSKRSGSPQGDAYKLLANGKELFAEGTHLSRNEKNKIVLTNKYALQHDLHDRLEVKDGQELKIELTLPDMYGILTEDLEAERIPVGFKEEFTVTVQAPGELPAHITVPEGQDNGVSVLGVENTAEYIKLNLEVPVWGYTQEEDMYAGTILKGTYNGCYLTTEDGQDLRRKSSLSDAEENVGAYSALKKGDKFQFTVGFEPAPAGCKKVVLRIDDSSSQPGENIFCELTIDLETGEAVATDTYRQEGLEKLDTEQYLNEYHTPDFRGGYYIDGVYEDIKEEYTVDGNGWIVPGDHIEGWKSQVQLWADKDEVDFELRFFRNGEQIDSIRVSTLDEYRHEVIRDDGETLVYYAHDFGGKYFLIEPTYTKQMEQMNFRTVPKWHIMAFVTGPERVPPVNVEGENPYPDRIQMVDSKTGEVLANDIAAADILGTVKCHVGDGAVESAWEQQRRYEAEQSEIEKAIDDAYKAQRRYEAEQSEIEKAIDDAYKAQNG